MDVVDSRGDEVGEIEDLVVNAADGSIHYAVLEFDRVWNPNDKLIALPMSSFRPAGDRNDLAIGMRREQIAKATSFEAPSGHGRPQFPGPHGRHGRDARPHHRHGPKGPYARHDRQRCRQIRSVGHQRVLRDLLVRSTRVASSSGSPSR